MIDPYNNNSLEDLYNISSRIKYNINKDAMTAKIMSISTNGIV